MQKSKKVSIESLKEIEDVSNLINEINEEKKLNPDKNYKNQFLYKIDELKEKSKVLTTIESRIHSEGSLILKKVEDLINELEQSRKEILEFDNTNEKPTLWIYGCSMSHKHDFPDHSKSWYTLLADKLGYNLEIRSNMAFGMNAIQRRLISDLPKIKRGKDLVIFSPSFFHRVYIEEFEATYRSFLPSAKQLDWYKYLMDLDDIVIDNYDRWITSCEIMLSLNINFRTWLLDPPLKDEYPFEKAKRIAKFDDFIFKPPVSPQVIGWMPFQKQHPEYWYSDEKGKEDHHWNIKGHEFLANEFYNQLFKIKNLF